MKMLTHTKIICTIGPAVGNLEKILELIDAGMNGARLNFSHGTHEQHLRVIEDLKKAREMRQVPLAIILDTKGPEIRIGKVENDSISVVAKQKILLVKESVIGNEKKLQITPDIALDAVSIGTVILFDDGYILSKVVEKTTQGVIVEIQNPGLIKSNKGVNIPDVNVGLPAMTEQDKADIAFGCKHDIDVLAASFIRSAEHVVEIKQLLAEHGKSDILVVAKIENSQGVQNFDSILQAADGIMVARGDLGVELPLKQVPSLQKMMIRKCCQVGKVVVTATQMLESMIKNPRPTRAEVSDVANAIYDATSAVMLSGETAVGQYPIETVKMMKGIVEEAEKNFNYREFFHQYSNIDYHDVASSVSLAAVRTAYSAQAKSLFVFTHSGATARLVSRFRPGMPIVVLTPRFKTYHQLALNWGIIPALPTETKNVQEALKATEAFALETGIVEYGDLVVIMAGVPFGISGTMNTIIVDSIGNVLVRGQSGTGSKVQGKVALVHSPEEYKNKKLAVGCIAVIADCNDTYFALLKNALAIILQNHPSDIESEKHAIRLGKTLDIPVLLRADGAMGLLKEGQTVTLDLEKGVVYLGSMP